ncbi:SspB family protein [Methyloraptor flagellatus]|jgi:hypothetical protein|uniref:ClpXP protease specificity-enhancing factor SspB n=1 Tax=Methyloraptor flagellatus TaxID=3162530 RepID=A0AAU7XCV1_9HYPH
MTQDLIRYDVLVQDALRGVVRKILAEVAQTGLPGQHHFYISFDTQHPGVRLSSRIRARYPEEMTIVLQHQFWDLTVTDHGFEVGLSFSGIPEKLLVPFVAVKGFFDPSVQFGLQFEVAREGEAKGETKPAEAPAKPVLKPVDTETAQDDVVAPALPAIAPAPAPVEPLKPAAKLADKAEPKPETDVKADAAKDEKPAEPPKATVVSLDQFRKKT